MTTSDTSARRRHPVNTRRRIAGAFLLLLLIAVSLSLVVIGPGSASSGELSGSVLIWHALTGPAADTLDKVIADYEDLNPRTKVYQQPFESDENLLQQYRETVGSGLGPDIMLGDAGWITTLAPEGSIRAIDEDVGEDLLGQYLPAAVQSVQYDGQLYGQPLSLRVPALYYNRSHVDSPPDTLDALVTQAAEGHTVLMSTDFHDALWGVQAFGGKFFDQDGRSILDQGGYANWLDWIMTVRTAPGMILDSSRETLQESFLQGDASYYVGYPDELQTLIDGLGEDNLGVAPLPSGPNGPSGPILDVDAFLFSPVSSRNQQEIAADLANFITNAEQSSEFMRQARIVPANTAVRINPRLFPLLAGFLTQARSAVAVPGSDTTDAMWAIAGNAYNRAMNGLSSPLEVAADTTRAINELNGFDSVARTESVCTDLGTVRVAHAMEGDDAQALEAIIEQFRRICPLVIVAADYTDLDDVRSEWQDNPTAATNADLVLASQEWLIAALQDGVALQDIGDKVPNETLQRFLPAALSGMRQGGRLLGLPMSVRVHVLYYNEQLVDDPAAVLDQLRLQTANGLPMVLTARFAQAYWGIGAFGGRLLDAQDLPALDEGGFANWLTWLRQSRDDHGMHLVFDNADAKNAFLGGTSGYYVGEPSERAELAAGIGEENLGIALLPAGPNGDATPLFVTSGLFFNGNLSERDVAAALSFALYATNADNQRLLVEQTEQVPANATVDPSGQPHVVTFLEQARSAYPLPNQTQIREVLTIGDKAYQAVLEDGVEPEDAVREAMQEINALYDIETEGDAPVDESESTGSSSATATPADAEGQTSEDDEIDQPLDGADGLQEDAGSADSSGDESAAEESEPAVDQP